MLNKFFFTIVDLLLNRKQVVRLSKAMLNRALGNNNGNMSNNGGASAVSDQNGFYMYLWLFLSQNAEKQYSSQPKSRSIASY